MYSFLRLMVFALLLTSLSGCYNKPVRHLASDIVLIQAGTSTREDVIMYLGEPDDIQVVATDVERWMYNDSRQNMQEGLPWVGKYLGTAEKTNVAVIIKNNVVVDSHFTSQDVDDLEWQKDFTWQEKEEGHSTADLSVQ